MGLGRTGLFEGEKWGWWAQVGQSRVQSQSGSEWLSDLGPVILPLSLGFTPS